MAIVVDTNIVSGLFAGDAEILENLDAHEDIYVPFIVVGELYAGYRNGTKFSENQTILRSFLDNPRVTILQSTDKTTELYGELFAFLRKQGTPIPINDVWIAAVAVEAGLPLYTLDSDFDNLPQLRRFIRIL